MKVFKHNGNIVDADSGEVLITKSEMKEQFGPTAQLVETDDNGMAIGIAYPNNMKTSRDYLHNLDDWKFTNSDVMAQMEVCDKMYRYEGVVGSVVDMMVDLANTEIILDGLENDRAVSLIRTFMSHINRDVETVTHGIRSFAEQGMTQFLIYGNVFPFKSWREFNINSNRIEMPNITYLNPLRVTVNEELIPFGIESLSLNLDKAKVSRTNVPVLRSLLQRETRGRGKSRTVELDPELVAHIKRKARDWEAWGVPFLSRAFSAVASKRKLRRLDDSTTEGLINYLTIFKIGSDQKDSPYHEVHPSRITAFANLIRNPTASSTLVWAHDVDVITTGPDGKVLSFKDKYAEVDADIMKSLGIGAGIFDQGAASEEAILMFLETLESMRNHFLAYIHRTCEEILERNGITDTEFTLSFAHIKLGDILQKLKSLVLSYYDRGLLSYETALTLGGHKFIDEVERKKDEQELRDEGLFNVPNLPFSATNEEVNNNPSTRDDGRPADEVQTEEPDVDNDVSAAMANQAFIIKYAEALNVAYNNIRLNAVAHVSDQEQLDLSSVSTLIRGGFNTIKDIAKSSLAIAYDENVDHLIFQKLVAWNDNHFDRLANQLVASINNELTTQFSDPSLIIPLIETAFANEQDRLNTFAQEGYVKSALASAIVTVEDQGIVGGFWRCVQSDGASDACAAKDGNWYTLAEVFELFPSHPGCRCDIDWTSNNPIAEGSHQNKTATTAPNRPDKLL